MNQIIVKMDPIQSTEIYEVTDKGMVQLKIFNFPNDSLNFIKNYTQSKGKDVEVIFVGPKTYTKHFVDKAKQYKFVIASQG